MHGRWLLLATLVAACTAAPSPATPGGIVDAARAATLARAHVTPEMRLVSVESGRFADLALIPVGPGDPTAPDRHVWAVTFEGPFVICPPTVTPLGSPCWAPRPGTSRVFLDYTTGEFLSNQGRSP